MDEKIIDKTLDALERLMRMFALERILYLLCSFAGFGLLIACIVVEITQKKLTVPELSTAFASTGLIGASSMRVSYFLNRSFDLIAEIIKGLSNARPGS